jgi:hypothetical protein
MMLIGLVLLAHVAFWIFALFAFPLWATIGLFMLFLILSGNK